MKSPPKPHGSALEFAVRLCEDALLEPLWPEDVGIVCGFFAVLDVCYVVRPGTQVFGSRDLSYRVRTR